MQINGAKQASSKGGKRPIQNYYFLAYKHQCSAAAASGQNKNPKPWASGIRIMMSHVLYGRAYGNF